LIGPVNPSEVGSRVFFLRRIETVISTILDVVDLACFARKKFKIIFIWRLTLNRWVEGQAKSIPAAATGKLATSLHHAFIRNLIIRT